MSKLVSLIFLISFSSLALAAKNEAIVLGSTCHVDKPVDEAGKRIDWDFKKSQKDMVDGLSGSGWNVKKNFISAETAGPEQITNAADAKAWMKKELRKSYCESGASQLLLAFNAHGSENNPMTGKSDHSICLFKADNHMVKDDTGRLYMSEIKQWISAWQKEPDCPSKPQLAIVDRSCHSGGATEQLGDMACVITATTDQVAAAGSNGIFQNVAGLLKSPTDAGKANSLNPDNGLSMDEAFLYSLLNPGAGSSQLRNQPQFSGCIDPKDLTKPADPEAAPKCGYINHSSSLDFLTEELYPEITKYSSEENRLLLQKMSNSPVLSGDELKNKIAQDYPTRKSKTEEYEALSSGEEHNLASLNALLANQATAKYVVPVDLNQVPLSPSEKTCFQSFQGNVQAKLTGASTRTAWNMSGNNIVDFGVMNSSDWSTFGSELVQTAQQGTSSSCSDADLQSIGPKVGSYLNKENTASFNNTFNSRDMIRTSVEQARKQHEQLRGLGQESYNQLLRDARAYAFLKCVEAPTPAMKKCQTFKLRDI